MWVPIIVAGFEAVDEAEAHQQAVECVDDLEAVTRLVTANQRQAAAIRRYNAWAVETNEKGVQAFTS